MHTLRSTRPGSTEVRPDRVDPARYSSPAWAELEWEHVFRRCWLYAVPFQDVTEPGSWATFEIGPESLLVSRTQEGTLTAHYNVCQHRGRRLVDGERGVAAAFRCPYHAWTYRLDGSLRTVHEPQVFSAGLDMCKLGLKEVKVDTWGGLVWVCFDPDAEPLVEYLEVVPEQLKEFPLERYALVREHSIEWDCNWKVGVDGFHESYHNVATHPQMTAYVADVNVDNECYTRHSRFLMPMLAPSPRVRDRSRPNGVQAKLLESLGVDVSRFDGTADDAHVEIQHRKRAALLKRGCAVGGLPLNKFTDISHYTIFPNTQIGVIADEMLITRHRPHRRDPQRMIFDVQQFNHVAPSEPWPARPDVIRGAGADFPIEPKFLRQDASNAPAVQAGLRSAGFRGSVLSDLEQRIGHFHSVLDHYMADGR